MSAMYSKHTQENGLRTADERIPNLLLRNVRKQNGWTRKVMAEKLGVAAVSIGRWERGEVVPNQYDRDLLCKLFHMRSRSYWFGTTSPRSHRPIETAATPSFSAITFRVQPFCLRTFLSRRFGMRSSAVRRPFSCVCFEYIALIANQPPPLYRVKCSLWSRTPASLCKRCNLLAPMMGKQRRRRCCLFFCGQ